MPTCPRCGRESPGGFRFCGACAAPLIGTAGHGDVRKTVTVVFSDLTGSTALGERLDAESVRAVMTRCFSELRTGLERHGGTVEKFIGDAVMAVFGLPQVHEDDALRAVRAAVEIRERLAILNKEFEPHLRVHLQGRTGVNTGEVVAGEGETLVTGDAVNVAARLEQVAQPGEILLGEHTYRLVRGTVRVEALGPLLLRGKSEAVPAFRLVEVLPDKPALTQPGATPFVGRSEELEALRRAFARARDQRRCQLCTVVGSPGIGKSRLALELVRGAADAARVLVGRCLPYGEGITYWPLAEIVRQLGWTDPEEELAALVGGEDGRLVSERIIAAVGAVEIASFAGEIAWAFRRMFEALAHEKPLLVVFDDIHWAEPTLLDLIDYVNSHSADAPILLLCLARLDLFEVRPLWARPRPNATMLTLEPLAPAEAETLVDHLVGARELSQQTRTRVVDAAEGNPLFVEQLLAMQAESGNHELEVPRTIQALLAARVDRLVPEERIVLQSASVEGRMFHKGGVAALVPESVRPVVDEQLMALVRKEFIQPDRTLFPGDESFRFRHILIRDAAYGFMPKQLRAELHERCARWLERQVGAQSFQHEEILGYHMEQATRYRLELGGLDSQSRQLSAEAVDRLSRAGRRALSRGDASAATNLLGRATSLPADPGVHAELLFGLGTALLETGDPERADAALGAAVEAAQSNGRDEVEWRARVASAAVRLWLKPEQAADELTTVADRAVTAFDRLHDDAGLAEAWRLLGQVRVWGGQGGAAHAAAEQALEHAQRANDEHEVAQCIVDINIAILLGPTPVEEGIVHAQRLLATFGTNRTIEGTALSLISVLLAMAGRFAEAREAIANAKANAEELGQRFRLAVRLAHSGMVEMWAGELETAEAELRRSLASVEKLGGVPRAFGRGTTPAIDLAEVLLAQGRWQEASDLLDTQPQSAWSVGMRIGWLSIRARTMARLGRAPEAEVLAREACRLAAHTDFLSLHGNALLSLADVLCISDGPEEALACVSEAVELYGRKGDIVSVGKGRLVLVTLRRACQPAP